MKEQDSKVIYRGLANFVLEQDNLTSSQQKEMYTSLKEVVDDFKVEAGISDDNEKLTVDDLVSPKKREYKAGKWTHLSDIRVYGCVLTKNRSPWCYGMCEYGEDKIGACGRLAPHSLKGSTQRAIENYKKKKTEEEKAEE